MGVLTTRTARVWPMARLAQELVCAVRLLSRATVTAYAGIVFSADPRVGLWLLAASSVDLPRGLLALAVTFTSLGCLRAFGVTPNERVLAGYGYSTILVALTIPSPISFAGAISGAALGLAAAFLSLALKPSFEVKGVPLLAAPFVFTAMWLTQASSDIGVSLPRPTGHLVDLLLSSFGALVCTPRAEVGVVVLLAIGLGSRLGLLVSVLATLLGLGLAEFTFPGRGQLAVVCGYNAAVTALALFGALASPTIGAFVYAEGAAVLASILAGVLSPFLAERGLPTLAWPFVLVTWVAYRALRVTAPPWFKGVLLPGQSPEANLTHLRMLKARFGQPGPPQLKPPFLGRWRVTQGAFGGITHVGAFGYALDFEIADEDNFPFQGKGERLEDYYCFGKPVLSPGYGTVAHVTDTEEDCAPGKQNLERPWGNAISVYHSAGCYSLVAHLKKGSALVRVGDRVVPGQPLALAGSSGRSPRPHLHLQLQATAEPGAPCLPFHLVNYSADIISGERTFHRSGLPQEWDFLAPEEPELASTGPRVFEEPLEFLSSTGQLHRIEIQADVGGESYLHDTSNGDRLYFLRAPLGIIFTTLRGRARGLLACLYHVAPFLPGRALGPARMEEPILSAFGLGGPLLARLSGNLRPGAAVKMRVSAATPLGHFGIESQVALTRNSKSILSGSGRFDSSGPLHLELIGPALRGALTFERISSPGLTALAVQPSPVACPIPSRLESSPPFVMS